ncbi:MAG: hypothetical protein WCI12_06295 [Actinomycetes bacterium]
MAEPLLGRVTAFDEERGLGDVVLASGDALRFHSTAISDASRRIAIGTHVAVLRSAAHGGTMEASIVVKLPA